jgi:putative nucleotidyltransferase with HDIG domain
MTESKRRSLNLELMPSDVPGAVAYHAVRWGLLVALALLTYLVFPVAGARELRVPPPGTIAPDEVIAPFAFVVPKTEAELEADRTELEAVIRPIFDYLPDVRDSVLRRADSLFVGLDTSGTPAEVVAVAQAYGVLLEPDEAEYLQDPGNLARFRRDARDFLSDGLRRGVAPRGTIEAELRPEIIIRRGQSQLTARVDTVLTRQEFLRQAGAVRPASDGSSAFVKVVAGLFRATLVPNVEVYEEARQRIRASVPTVKDSVRADERIVDANEPVTQAVYDRLVALEQELLRRGGRGEGDVVGTAAQVLANGLVLSVFWLLIMLYRPMTYQALRHMLVVAIVFGLVILASASLREWIAAGPELVPVPFAAMMMTVLFRGRVAMVAAMVLAVLITSQAAYAGGGSLLIALVGGVAAAVSVRTIRRRDQFLLAAAVVAAAYLVAGLVVGARLGWSVADIGLTGVRGGANALASAALVSMLLPLFEALARQTTDLTLLELSDPSRPLLRRLATEAAGTYAHSIGVANLCEAACNAVGANGLLARVGSYYHDVGKLKKPQYFVENQAGAANPHDKLKPDVSAGIIRGHVRDGLTLAEEQKLPNVVKAFIPEHHGTMEITYFLDRARQRDPEQEIDPADFRYPGPLPRTVETAVAMLADGVEAAVRVLDEPSPERVREAIEHIVRQRVESGQLRDAPLTLAQLSVVQDEFARVLGGTHHARIDYPAASGGIGADWEATAPA